jgi:SAM-dependent methyltransferase
MRSTVRWLGLALCLVAVGGLAAPLPPAPVDEARADAAAQAPAPAPAPEPAPKESERPTSTPYAGDLSIFEDDDRAKNLQIDRVMDILGVREGASVADVGAGSGWFTVRAARRVGASGAVYAVDINQEFLDHIARRARTENLPNVKTVLGGEDDPRLPRASVDAVLVLKTYHEVAKPVTLMRHLRDALKPGGLVGIIDRDGKGDDHGVKAEVVIDEMGRAGFELVSRHDFVKPDKMDYFLVFKSE